MCIGEMRYYYDGNSGDDDETIVMIDETIVMIDNYKVFYDYNTDKIRMARQLSAAQRKKNIDHESLTSENQKSKEGDKGGCLPCSINNRRMFYCHSTIDGLLTERDKRSFEQNNSFINQYLYIYTGSICNEEYL